MKCPCHSGKSYSQCCQPYHQGKSLPPTPLDLMRSRYCAYALGLVDYIVTTTHPNHPDSSLNVDLRKKQIENFCQHTTFQGLEILEAENDTVTFRALLMQNGKDVSFTEMSAFAKKNGRWYYRSARILK